MEGIPPGPKASDVIPPRLPQDPHIDPNSNMRYLLCPWCGQDVKNPEWRYTNLIANNGNDTVQVCVMGCPVCFKVIGGNIVPPPFIIDKKQS